MNMNHNMTRVGLYIERFGTSFAMGIFFVLPLHFKSLGWDETFFGQIYAVGAIGTILTIVLSAQLIRKFGFGKIAPLGSLLYAIGCLLYFIFDRSHNVYGYYCASLLQGAGWGLTFTVGPIGIASTLSETDNANRIYYFTIHATYTALGAGSSPFIIRYFTSYLGLTVEHLFLLATLTTVISYIISARVAWNNQAYKKVKVDDVSVLSGLLTVLRQPSVYFFVMIFFGACIYTATLSLQMTFAALKKIDYIVFYGFYSLAIILARLIFAKTLAKIAAEKSIPFLVLMLTVGIGFLFFATNSSIYYALSASLIGTGYGLAYCVVQTEAVRYVPPILRPTVLVYFSLSYFLGVYLFPYFAALIATQFSYEMLWFSLIIFGLAYLATVVYFYKIVRKKLDTTALA